MLLGLPLSLRNRKILEHLQKCTCRTILGQRYITYATALETCGLGSLADRREGHCRGFAEGLANSELTNNLLPPTRLESHACNLRNASNYSHLRIRTSRFKKVQSHTLSTSKSVNRHCLSEQSYHFVIPCEPKNHCAILLSYYAYIYIYIYIYMFIYFNSIFFS